MIFLSLILEIIFQIVATLAIEFVVVVTDSLNRDRFSSVAASVWVCLVSLAVGGVTGFAVPWRIFEPGDPPGLSVVVVAALLAMFMEVWGRTRRALQKPYSHLATWYGGTSAGLGLTVGRLVALAFMEDVNAL